MSPLERPRFFASPSQGAAGVSARAEAARAATVPASSVRSSQAMRLLPGGVSGDGALPPDYPAALPQATPRPPPGAVAFLRACLRDRVAPPPLFAEAFPAAAVLSDAPPPVP